MARRKSKKGAFRKGAALAASAEIILNTIEPTPEFKAKHALERVKTDQSSHTLRVRDKRPIDNYHRLYCIDQERGVGEQHRRGITEDQYRAADRLSCNYERTFHNLSKPLDAVHVQCSVNVSLYPVESIMNAIHTHTRVMRALNRISQDIVETICCREGCLTDYEQAHGWRKGYGMIRLREALDELTEAFRTFGKANRDTR